MFWSVNRWFVLDLLVAAFKLGNRLVVDCVPEKSYRKPANLLLLTYAQQTSTETKLHEKYRVECANTASTAVQQFAFLWTSDEAAFLNKALERSLKGLAWREENDQWIVRIFWLEIRSFEPTSVFGFRISWRSSITPSRPPCWSLVSPGSATPRKLSVSILPRKKKFQVRSWVSYCLEKHTSVRPLDDDCLEKHIGCLWTWSEDSSCLFLSAQ